jgi:predicted RNase H-like HicB family nuclease
LQDIVFLDYTELISFLAPEAASTIERHSVIQYQIFVEDHYEQHFVASVIGMPNIKADGRTESEAVSRAEAALHTQLAKVEIITVKIDIHLSSTPYINAGILQNDPTFNDWMERLAEIRRQANEEDDHK